MAFAKIINIEISKNLKNIFWFRRRLYVATLL